MSGKRFEGQTAVITGGSRGIGRAIAVRLASEGANVVLAYAGNDAAAEESVRLCKEAGDDRIIVKSIKCDVANMEDCEKLFKEAGEITGRIEILVNNAGITRDGLLLRMKPEDFDRVQQVNLYGTFNCMKTASRLMLRQKYGRIISISSIVGLRGNMGQVNYAASKAGIIGMTKSLAKEFASKGITVNAIAPGFIATDMTDAMTDAAKEAVSAGIPMGYVGSPEDVAAAAAFFASSEAAYITGQVLSVDGGMAM